MIDIKNLSVSYPGHDFKALHATSLHIGENEFVLVCGPSGCGKSSLMLCLNGIMHHETNTTVDGCVCLNGKDIRDYSLPEICTIAGSVFQNPATQLCTSVVESEVAFGLENQNLSLATMERRIDEALRMTGLSEKRFAKVQELSGGQQQRLTIACALALQPKILLLDEPTSQLDPIGAREILSIISDLKTHWNLTVVMIEHRLETPLQLADRVLVMDEGKVVLDTSSAAVFEDSTVLRKLGLQIPSLPVFFEKIGRRERPVLAKDAPRIQLKCCKAENVVQLKPQKLLTVDALHFTYPKGHSPVLQNISFELFRGNRIALLGANGSGKSTLLHLLSGLLKPNAGKIRWQNGVQPSIGMVSQNPDVMLFSDTVEEELIFGPLQQGKPKETLKQHMEDTLSRFSLTPLRHRPPFALSRGERQRTAMGSIATLDASVVLLDEPTTGQDRARIEKMMTAIGTNANAIVFSTHDVELASYFADRIIVLAGACITAMGTPIEVLKETDVLAHAGICLSELQQFSLAHNLSVFHIDEMPEVIG